MSQPITPVIGVRREFQNAALEHRRIAQQPLAERQGGASVQPPVAPEWAPDRAPERAIANAAQKTGVDFDFLIAQAQVESGMDPAAKARTSSATGLYQFIESTWLETMQRHGARFGLGDVAGQIGTTGDGAAHVPNRTRRDEILALRSDPQIASLMAAGLAQDNRAALSPILGRQPDNNELYLAHFLGAGGAGRFLSAMKQDPDQSAAALFQRPAAANRGVFFEHNGTPRSLEGVMEFLSNKLEIARADAPQSRPSLQAPSANMSGSGDQASFGSFNPAQSRSRTLFGREFGESGSHPAIAGGPSSRSYARPMSDTLREMFGAAPSGDPEAAQRVERAYSQLKALGL